MKYPDKMLDYQNPWDREKTMQVAFIVDHYVAGNGLYVGMYALDEEGFLSPWCDVTVNLGNYCYKRSLKNSEAYIDMPNISDSQFLDWLRKNDLISDYTGECGYSGFCEYPLVQFNLENLEKYSIR